MRDGLARLVQSLGRPRVLVVGDLILDKFVWGKVGRISPEAPIQILAVERKEYRPGGAANVVGAAETLAGGGLSLTGPLGFAIAFGAGILAFLSPCVPLIATN